MNKIASKMMPERIENVGKHLVVTNKERLHKPEGLILLELKESRSATC